MFFKDDNESSNNTEKVTMREESCNQGKERKHAEYKGFEKVVKNMVPACEEVGLQVHKEPACEEEGLDKVPACKEAGPQKEPDYEEAGLDQEVFNQSNIGCEEVEVTEKKEKRGRERFDQDFARKGHKVGNLMKRWKRPTRRWRSWVARKRGLFQLCLMESSGLTPLLILQKLVRGGMVTWRSSKEAVQGERSRRQRYSEQYCFEGDVESIFCFMCLAKW